MQIVFLILKIIGFTLLGVLGLFLLILLSVLFLPIVYRLEGQYEDGTPGLHLKIHWMFPFFCINGGLDEDNKPWYCFRILGYPFRTSRKKEKPGRKKAAGKRKAEKEEPEVERRPEDGRSSEISKPLAAAEHPAPEKGTESLSELRSGVAQTEETEEAAMNLSSGAAQTEEPEGAAMNLSSGAAQTEETEEAALNLSSDAAGMEENGNTWEEGRVTDKSSGEKEGGTETKEEPPHGETEEEEAESTREKRLFSKIKNIFQKVKNIFRTIKEKIRGIKGKFKKIGEKLEQLRSFLDNTKNRRGFRSAGRFVKKAVGHLKPTRVKGRVRFGLEDPASTGKLYGMVTLLYGWYGDSLEVIPEFDGPVVEGHLKIKGRIVLGVLGILFLKLWRDEDFKYLLAEARQLKEDL